MYRPRYPTPLWSASDKRNFLRIVVKKNFRFISANIRPLYSWERAQASYLPHEKGKLRDPSVHFVVIVYGKFKLSNCTSLRSHCIRSLCEEIQDFIWQKLCNLVSRMDSFSMKWIFYQGKHEKLTVNVWIRLVRELTSIVRRWLILTNRPRKICQRKHVKISNWSYSSIILKY